MSQKCETPSERRGGDLSCGALYSGHAVATARCQPAVGPRAAGSAHRRVTSPTGTRKTAFSLLMVQADWFSLLIPLTSLQGEGTLCPSQTTTQSCLSKKLDTPMQLMATAQYKCTRESAGLRGLFESWPLR